jgi:predicted aspartyl protease
MCLPQPSVAESIPDSQTIRDRNMAAAGPTPDSYHEEIDFSGTTGSGKEVIFRRGPDRREIDDSGSLHTEFGINAGQRWHENENGHVVIDEADPGLATREQFTTTVTHVTEPTDAYVISSLNAKGFGSRNVYDAKTWYEIKREVRTPNGTITTVFDDFKTFGTRHLAAHWSTHDETRASQTDYVRSAYAADDVSTADVAIPQIAHPLVDYPAGVNRVDLPAVFEPSGHIVVRLSIRGRGLDFLLDTGSANITLDPAVAHDIGLSVTKKGVSSQNAGRFDTGVAIVPQIDIGQLHMHNAAVAILPLAFEEGEVKTVGLLGFDFLCESGITIDYEHHEVVAERYGTYTPPQAPHVIALTIRLGAQVPMTSVNVNGAIAERIMLDTGAAGPFMLFDFFARRHPEALPEGLGDHSVAFRGAGGAFDAKTVTLDTFRLGNVNFTHFTGYRVTSAASYTFDQDGVIGPDFLKFFDVHLDYPNGMIYLVPNATGARAMH